MNWQNISNIEDVDRIINTSNNKPQVIFKHSTRCSISSVAKNRLDKNESDSIDFHYLDLIAYREVSNYIAEKLAVHHESPQVLLIKNGECVFDESHSSIYFDEIIKQAFK